MTSSITPAPCDANVEDEQLSGKVKVVLVGSLSGPLVEPLVSMTRAVDPSILFDSVGTWTLLDQDESPPVDQHRCGIADNPATGLRRWSRFIRVTKLRIVWNRLCHHAESVCDAVICQRSFDRQLQEYDLIHVQSLFDARLMRLLIRSTRLPPMVVSAWGSDVLRQSDIELFILQQSLLRKAKAITISGIEMREIVLAKYGRDLQGKIRENFFSPDHVTLDAIASHDRETAKSWLATHVGLDPKKITICVGHNGSKGNQHLAVIDELGKLPDELKRNIQIVCPMAYGVEGDYEQAVKKCIDANQLEGAVTTRFLESAEVAFLRKGSDLFLFVPVSDSFAASVSQALAAECLTIVGSWLPYGRRRRAGFRYWEVDQLSELSTVVESLCADLETHRSQVRINARLTAEFFDVRRLGKSWSDVYRETSARHVD